MVELYVGYTREDTSRSISMLPCPPLNFKANEEAYTGFSPRRGIKQNRGVQQFMYAIFIIVNAWAGSRRSLAVIYKDRRTLLSDTVNYQITIYHLTQHVNTPTRGQNALDLVISDLPGTVSVSTLPPLGRSDHCVVTADFKTAAPLCEPPTTRQVWRYAHAGWDRMRAHFCRIDWTAITHDCPEQCCMNISQTILDAMTQFIPSKKTHHFTF